MWWKRFFESIRFDTEETLKIQCDNRQTIRILTKEMMKLSTQLRHVDIHQHWLRQEVQAGRINVEWVPTNQMPADGFTKALSRQKHENFMKQTKFDRYHRTGDKVIKIQLHFMANKAGGVC